jgi:hypothetical protein
MCTAVLYIICFFLLVVNHSAHLTATSTVTSTSSLAPGGQDIDSWKSEPEQR